MRKVYALLMRGLAAVVCCCSFGLAPAQTAVAHHSHQYYLFIGTYAPADSNGIFVYRFNTATGKARFVSSVSGIENPSFLNFSPNHRFVYAVSETHGGAGGQVYAYAFDRRSGRLIYLDQQLSRGDDPCNIATDHTGKWLFAANYSSGNFSLFPIEKNGSVERAVQTIQHDGHGVNAVRQEKPHVHCVLPAPNNRDIFVTDLGLDKVFTYELDAATGHLSAGKPPYIEVIPGTGPRHLDFSPDGKYLYLIQEIGGKITVFAYHPGKLKTVQTLSTVPEGFQGRIWAADIHLSPDGKFLYASNRDDLNDIAVYAVDTKTGKLTFRHRIASGGRTPRNFTLTPDGKYLLAGHQNSGEITIFRRDKKRGLLIPAGHNIPVAHAVCLKMIPVN